MNGLNAFRLLMAFLIGFGVCYVWLDAENCIPAQWSAPLSKKIAP